MDEEYNKVVFTAEDGEAVEFFVLSETTLSGRNYLLVADSLEEEADALILKETAGETDEVIYDLVEDDNELRALSEVFEQLIDDIEIETNFE